MRVREVRLSVMGGAEGWVSRWGTVWVRVMLAWRDVSMIGATAIPIYQNKKNTKRSQPPNTNSPLVLKKEKQVYEGI